MVGEEAGQRRPGGQDFMKTYMQKKSAGAKSESIVANSVRWQNLLPIIPQETGGTK